MMGLGPMELVIALALGLGGGGLPVGMPPTAEDPLLARIELGWHGEGRPSGHEPY
jgi:hypothetical protein